MLSHIEVVIIDSELSSYEEQFLKRERTFL